MLVTMDVIGIFEKALRRSGFRDNGPVGGSMGRLHANGKKKIVTIRTIKVPGGVARDLAENGGVLPPYVMDDIIADFFKRLVAELRRVAAEGNVPCDLVFQGGGNIPIPPEVRRMLEEMGFTISFVTFGPEEEGNVVQIQGEASLGECFGMDKFFPVQPERSYHE